MELYGPPLCRERRRSIAVDNYSNYLTDLASRLIVDYAEALRAASHPQDFKLMIQASGLLTPRQ